MRSIARGGEFPDQTNWIPEDQLEIETEVLSDPIKLLARGELAGISALRRLLTHVRLSGRLANVVYSMGINRDRPQGMMTLMPVNVG